MSNNNEESKMICVPFASKLIDDMEQLFDSKIASDIIFDLPDGQIPAHKAILMARVPVFEKMFASGMMESQSDRVQIVDSNHKSFDTFLRYVYCGKLSEPPAGNFCSLELWEGLLLLASKYDVPGLVPHCVQRMRSELKKRVSIDGLVSIDDLLAGATRMSVDDLLAGATRMSQFSELYDFPTVKQTCEEVLIYALAVAKLKADQNRDIRFDEKRFFSDYLLSLILFAHLHDCRKLHLSCLSHRAHLRLEGEVAEKLKAQPDLVEIITGLVGEDKDEVED